MVCLQEVYETLCSAVHNEAILILNRLELERNRHVPVIYATKGDMGVQYGFEAGNVEKVFRYDGKETPPILAVQFKRLEVGESGLWTPSANISYVLRLTDMNKEDNLEVILGLANIKGTIGRYPYKMAADLLDRFYATIDVGYLVSRDNGKAQPAVVEVD